MKRTPERFRNLVIEIARKLRAGLKLSQDDAHRYARKWVKAH